MFFNSQLLTFPNIYYILRYFHSSLRGLYFLLMFFYCPLLRQSQQRHQKIKKLKELLYHQYVKNKDVKEFYIQEKRGLMLVIKCLTMSKYVPNATF